MGGINNANKDELTTAKQAGGSDKTDTVSIEA